MTDLENLDRKLTDAEFADLPRNSDGDLIDLSIAFVFLTDPQVEKLSHDDWARYDDLQEELRCLMADCMAEFG